MVILTFALLTGGVPADTLRPTVADVLETALVRSNALLAARERERSAAGELDQAGAFENPILSLSAENVGASERLTGVPGWRGLEGQVLLGALLPVGGDRRAGLRRAGALRDAAGAERDRSEADLRVRVLKGIAASTRDVQLASHAAEERDGLHQLAASLALGADAGRFSEGDAARARLAAVRASTEEARRRAAVAATDAELAHLMGVEPGTVIRVMEPPPCSLPGPHRGGRPPELALMRARVGEAEAETALRQAGRIPDLQPQVGVQRIAGTSSLHLGFEVALPAFDRSSAAVRAARAQEAAARADEKEVLAGLDAALGAARQAVVELEVAGRLFDDGWFEALDRAAEAAEARHEQGEGSLTELLDGRRARLEALDDLARWRAEVQMARVRSARLGSDPLDAELLCDGITRDGGGE